MTISKHRNIQRPYVAQTLLPQPHSTEDMMKKLLEAHKDKAALLEFRKQAYQRTVNSNYRSEYERVAGILQHTVVRQASSGEHRRLEHRRNELRRLLKLQDDQ